MPNNCILSEEMAEDRRTGAPVLSATGSYVENIPGAESPVIRSSETFSPATLAKGRFSAEKSSVNNTASNSYNGRYTKNVQ